MKKILFIITIIIIIATSSFILVYYSKPDILQSFLETTKSDNLTAEGVNNTKVIDGSYGCAMGPGYDYQVKDNYPVLVSRRVVGSKAPYQTLIKFQELPLNEAEFLKLASVSEDEAVMIIDKKIIKFSNYSIPKSSILQYAIEKNNIQAIRLISLRSSFCNTSYGQGTIDSAVRVVWEITMKPTTNSKLERNPSYQYTWLIFVDAVTGEVVKAIQSTAADGLYKPIPNWSVDFNLKKIGDEYIQSTF